MEIEEDIKNHQQLQENINKEDNKMKKMKKKKK